MQLQIFKHFKHLLRTGWDFNIKSMGIKIMNNKNYTVDI